MEYNDLRPALEAYRRGDNVTETLRQLLNSPTNSPEIIEVAYDLQAGTYVDYVRQDETGWRNRIDEMGGILAPYLANCDSILDAGTGELTTFAGLAATVYPPSVCSYACDLSWSRLKVGQGFVAARTPEGVRQRLTVFVADMMRLPFCSSAIDVVWTSHAIEPNGGRERQILRELLRVTRQTLVLFEPSYEAGDNEAKARMERLGYVRGLPEAIAAEGGEVLERVPLRYVANPLNPTVALIVRPPSSDAKTTGIWACPATGLPMEVRDDCYWSSRSLLAYPVLGGIPILRKEAAILAAGLT